MKIKNESRKMKAVSTRNRYIDLKKRLQAFTDIILGQQKYFLSNKYRIQLLKNNRTCLHEISEHASALGFNPYKNTLLQTQEGELYPLPAHAQACDVDPNTLCNDEQREEEKYGQKCIRNAADYFPTNIAESGIDIVAILGKVHTCTVRLDLMNSAMLDHQGDHISFVTNDKAYKEITDIHDMEISYQQAKDLAIYIPQLTKFFQNDTSELTNDNEMVYYQKMNQARNDTDSVHALIMMELANHDGLFNISLKYVDF
jgi:hypothetical protein